MELAQPVLLTVFFVTVTVGYVWAERGRVWGESRSSQTAVAVKEDKATRMKPVAPQGEPKAAKTGRRSFSLGLRRAKALPVLDSAKVRPAVPGGHAELAPRIQRKRFSFLSRKSSKSQSAQLASQELKPAALPATAQQAPTPLQGEQILIDNYVVKDPFVRIGISLEPDGSKRYTVIEPRLGSKERKQLRELKEVLRNGLEVDVTSYDPTKATTYLSLKTKEIMKKFGFRLPRDTYEKLFYFIERDFVNYGKVDPIMRDPNIEDISCNGPALPVYVFHRAYESIPTNVTFRTQEELEKYVLRLAYMSGRNISVAEPMVDASLPDGSRVQLTFGSEITKKGSTFTIRKFKEDPFSIVDLIKFGTITVEIAALLWFALENKSSVLLAGGTASGKTTTINCLALFIRPEAKIVTLEDTPEINLAHKNWIQSISRQGMAGTGEVTLYDLLRAALRQRPDFIVPGEVRGEEAQTMFQAISTGHAGMSSIHADSIPAVFNRLTNPPMSIPRTLLPALNFVLLQSRVTIKGKPTRRILSVTEVVGLDTRTNELITNELYRYNIETDEYVYSGRSYYLEKLAKTKGLTMDELKQELATREQILQWMVSRGLRKYRDVANMVQRYYTDRAGLLAELGTLTA